MKHTENSNQQIKKNREAAEYLGVSTMTLFRIRTRGEINFRRVGGQVFFTQDDLEQYLEQQKCVSARDA